jgi:hypothetical protein
VTEREVVREEKDVSHVRKNICDTTDGNISQSIGEKDPFTHTDIQILNLRNSTEVKKPNIKF